MDEIPIKMAKLETIGRENIGRGTRGGLRRTFRIVEPNLQPADITEKTGNLGRTVKLQSYFTKFSVLRSDKFMIYDSVFQSVGLSPKVKIQFIMRVCQDNKLPGAFCLDGRRLYTSENWHGESDIREFAFQEKKLSIRLVDTIRPETEEYYQMINVLFNNLQVLMGQERIGKRYFLRSNITKDEVPQNNGPTFFKTDGFTVLGGFGTTLQRGTQPTGELTTLLLYIERKFIILNHNSVKDAYNEGSIDQLIGRDIVTKYNNKTYRISEIKEMSVDEKFEMSGRTLSYAEYFNERYKIQLTQGDQPFVLTGVNRLSPLHEEDKENEGPEDKDMTYIPGELCSLCGFSDQEKSNKDLQESLGNPLKRTPLQKLDDIPDFCKWIEGSHEANGMCNKWQLKIDNQPLEIEGRELPPCDVISGGNKINEEIPYDWKSGRVEFDIKSDRKYKIDVVNVDGNDFHEMNDEEQQLSKEINIFDLIKNVKEQVRIMEINAEIVETEFKTCEPNVGFESYQCINAARSGFEPIALVLFPDNTLRAKVKSFTMSTGLLTQCVTIWNANTNIIMRQILAKFGYDPWTVGIKLQDIMIVGIDTYHNESNGKSIQASVFSINSTSTQYMSFVNQPGGRQEFHEAFKKNFNLALEDIIKRGGDLPRKLLVYRSGVEDDQLQSTKDIEVGAMKPLIEDICKTKKLAVPQIIYVIVRKNVKIKLFNLGNNPNPGTVVDKDIVKPNFYEFYLVSQRTTEGIPTPTNYIVLENTRLLTEEGTMDPMAPNELQQITYALTHLYFNWMGTIRVPAPVHYAHRLAEFVGKVHEGNDPPEINERIRNRFFYI